MLKNIWSVQYSTNKYILPLNEEPYKHPEPKKITDIMRKARYKFYETHMKNGIMDNSILTKNIFNQH